MHQNIWWEILGKCNWVLQMNQGFKENSMKSITEQHLERQSWTWVAGSEWEGYNQWIWGWWFIFICYYGSIHNWWIWIILQVAVTTEWNKRDLFAENIKWNNLVLKALGKFMLWLSLCRVNFQEIRFTGGNSVLRALRLETPICKIRTLK